VTAILEERPVTRGILTIPDQSGGKVITWDPQDAREAAQAEDAFRTAMKDRMTPVRRHAGGLAADGTMGTVIRDFPSGAAEIAMQPRLVGG
jgi:hypothetical protein